VAVRAFVSRPDLTPPAVTVATSAGTGAQAQGLIVAAPFSGPGQHGPLMIDDQGEPVWFRPVSGPTAMNFHVQRYRGNPVLTWWEGQVDNGGYGGGTGVIVDRAYRELARVKAANGYQSDLHEFVITSRGTALIAVYNEVTADLSAFGGPVDGRVVEGIVQELEIPSGRLLFEWHSLDHVGLDESYRTYPTDPGQFEYFHLNSIAVDADGNLLVSARHTSTVYKVDRRTGAVIWRLGGKKSDFSMGPGASFNFQHDARRHADGTMTIFDNGAWGPTGVVEQMSRPMRLELDLNAMTASLAQVFEVGDPRLAVAMGDLQLLPDGGAFIGWGTAGSFSDIGPDGQLRLDAHFTGGGLTYRAYRFPWVGRPQTKPTVVINRDPSGTSTLHVSWNGATEVARWQVQAGRRADQLRPIQTVPRAGFETAIALPRQTGYVAIAAVDRKGLVLGTSKPQRA
jgi:Arylsulfotransferase (ASST)